MKIKNLFVCCLLIFLLAACSTQPMSDESNKASEQAVIRIVTTAMCIPMAAEAYHLENHKWPNSINELKVFYAEKEDNCTDVIRALSADTTFQTLPDDELEIQFQICSDAVNVSATLTISAEESKKINEELETQLREELGKLLDSKANTVKGKSD